MKMFYWTGIIVHVSILESQITMRFTDTTIKFRNIHLQTEIGIRSIRPQTSSAPSRSGPKSFPPKSFRPKSIRPYYIYYVINQQTWTSNRKCVPNDKREITSFHKSHTLELAAVVWQVWNTLHMGKTSWKEWMKAIVIVPFL